MTELINWTNSNQGIITALLTLVYIGATLWLADLARRQLRQATDLERSRTRPFVIFDLLVEHNSVFATVHNIGQTPAYDVRIVVAPNVQCLLPSPREGVLDIAFVARGVEMLAPQRFIRALMGLWSRVQSTHPELRFEGTVSYRGLDGTSYSEPFLADLSAQEGLLYRAPKDIDDVVQQLETIARTFGQIASDFSRLIVSTMPQAEDVSKPEAFVAEPQQGFVQEPPSKDSVPTSEPSATPSATQAPPEPITASPEPITLPPARPERAGIAPIFQCAGRFPGASHKSLEWAQMFVDAALRYNGVTAFQSGSGVGFKPNFVFIEYVYTRDEGFIASFYGSPAVFLNHNLNVERGRTDSYSRYRVRSPHDLRIALDCISISARDRGLQRNAP